MANKLPPHPDHTMQWSPREQRVLVGYFEPLQKRIAELEAQLASGQETDLTRLEFIAAYMGYCKDKAPDLNEVGLPYFGAGWRAKASQPIATRPASDLAPPVGSGFGRKGRVAA